MAAAVIFQPGPLQFWLQRSMAACMELFKMAWGTKQLGCVKGLTLDDGNDDDDDDYYY